jgi:cytochrome c peroxidase
MHPNKSDLISRIDLDAQERADIVAFLKTLTDEEFLRNPKFADPFAGQ